MDELVRHCLRELSFDGDFGCDVSRLRDFITEFYAHPPASPQAPAPAQAQQAQTVDDAFCAFVWSVIVQQPGVRVGTIPEGASAEVYVAPHPSVTRKTKEKGKGKAKDTVEEPTPATALDVVPDAAVRSLEELRGQYGAQLRVAADPETTFAALTGSHIRPSKLTPMIYTALQIITRGRDCGVSVLDLGRKSGYDQKTCFYIIKQLVELGLVKKLRQPGVSSNLCVHKYFYERSPRWKQVLEEEKRAVLGDDDSDSDQDPDQEETKPLAPVHFDPIDSRHLSSMPVLKARLAKLLRNCPSNMHTSTNLMVKIGFVNPTRSDRRFFRTRLRELMVQKFIEKVEVPRTHKGPKDKNVLCIRLITDETSSEAEEDVNMEQDSLGQDGAVQEEEEDGYPGLKAHITLHKQILDCLAAAGTDGMTVNELSAALSDFDKRTIDLLLNRLEKDPPPAHLADLGLAQLAESHGRERRYKYYTVAHYRVVAEREKMEDRRYRDVDLSAAGGFIALDPDAFYADEPDVVRRMHAHAGKEAAMPKKKGKARVNPILPDGSVKRGRPRKSVGDAPSPTKKGTKRKREEDGDGVDGMVGEGPPKKKRGRPPKNKPAAVAVESGAVEGDTPSVPPKRGRPPKQRPDAVSQADGTPSTSVVVQESISQGGPTPKKRGRPRKVKPSVAPQKEPADASTAMQDVGDVTVLDEAMSSPLSSLPTSPAPASVELPPEAPTVPAEPLSTSFETAAFETTPANNIVTPLRKSTRIPKVRKPGDSSSSRRQTRQSGPSSSVVKAETGPPATQPVEQQPQIATEASTTNDAPAPVSLSFYADAPPDIPIDPALLQGDGFQWLIAMSPEPPEFPQAGPSSGLDVSKKRDQPETQFAGPSPKRGKSGQAEADVSRYHTKANLSQSRRENELLRLLADAGGILNISSKEVYDAHAALVKTITEEGGIASTPPGTKIDKRTLDTTCRKLEDKGKIRIVKTSITFSGGRMVSVIHLPDVPVDALSAFLADLGQSVPLAPTPAPVRFIQEAVSYGGGAGTQKQKKQQKRMKERADAAPDHWDDETRTQESGLWNLKEFFQKDDTVIRDALLTEKNTVAQLYGYIVGKVARACALHKLTVGLFESAVASTEIVSHENRIIHASYYHTDLPISAYCSFVSALDVHPQLGELLLTYEGRNTPVRAIPKELHDALAPSLARSRARFISLLDFLQSLGLVIPLVPSISAIPAYICQPNEHHPSTFDVAPHDARTPGVIPLYWRFNDEALIHLWALGDGLPPVWKTAPVSTTQQTELYWRDLEKVCTDAKYAKEVLGGAPRTAGLANDDVQATARTLRRSFSWSATYSLSHVQTEYLRGHIDLATGRTPLDDPEHREEQLQRLSWVISADREVVARWFEKAQKKHLRDLGKIKSSKSKDKGKGKEKWTETTEEVFRRRAAEAKEQRERDWEDMVARVHPGALIQSAAQRVERLRTRFAQGSGRSPEKWEAKIKEAIREANMAAEQLLTKGRSSRAAQMPVVPAMVPAPVATNLQDRDVDELIASQGDRVPHEKKAKSKKGKEKDTGERNDKTPRRHRFLWTRDYDELVRDASVVIKARCRGAGRLDWGAMEQIFPAVPRNSVRQRLVYLKGVPGAEAYLTRLENKWHELWEQHRATDILPDADPTSATNFDLATHVKFLRRHIDKNAIRVGFAEVQSSDKVDLPASLEDISSHFEVVDKASAGPPWDFMWTVVAEEAREKQFAHKAFTTEVVDMPVPVAYESDYLHVADAAVKMAFGNPHETYDVDVASQFLKGVGEEPVRLTTTELLNRGVLAKLVRDPTKPKPGRLLKISDSNQNALSGQLPRELFQDATALEEAIGQQEDPDQWREWSLLASDGDTAFLLELASEKKVRFDVDTSFPRSMRDEIDWNSKKADDDHIETALRVRYVDIAGAPRERSVPEPSAEPSASGTSVGAEMQVDGGHLLVHGQKVDGEPGFCRHTSRGLVDCQTCLEQAKASLLRELGAEDAGAVEQILQVLREAGSSGLQKPQLLTKLGSMPRDTLFSVVERMTEGATPLAHWTGYAAVVLVSAEAIRPWTVTVRDAHDADSTFMILPRRWLDIYGRKLDEGWEAALRAVLGLILLHPGISQAEIRWRLRSVYDRQEVYEILQTLEDEGYIIPRVDDVAPKAFEGGPADERDEKVTFWSLAEGGRRWYIV